MVVRIFKLYVSVCSRVCMCTSMCVCVCLHACACHSANTEARGLLLGDSFSFRGGSARLAQHTALLPTEPSCWPRIFFPPLPKSPSTADLSS